MSLYIGRNTTDRLECSSSSATMNDATTVTMMLWVTPYVNVLNCYGMRKDTNPAGLGTKRLRIISGGGTLNFDGVITRATTNSDVRAADNTVILEKLQCFALSYTETDNSKLYYGDLNKPLAESAYTAGYPIVGAGATLSDGDTFWIGNSQAASPSTPARSIFCAAMYSVAYLTLKEMRDWQFAPWTKPRGCVGLWNFKQGELMASDLSGHGNHLIDVGGVVAAQTDENPLWSKAYEAREFV